MSQRTSGHVLHVWDGAEDFVIDLIVETLQRTKRWKRDGPALRVLNKRWKQRINESVLTLQPNICSDLPVVDPNFLSQFTRVTQLDTTEFQWTPEHFDSLCTAISQLSTLRELRVGVNVLDSASASCLAPLTRLTALDITSVGPCGGAVLSKLASLQLKELSLICKATELHSIMDHIPTLGTLKLTLPMRTTSVDLSVLRSLDALHLRWTGVSLYYASVLLDLTSLVSLHIPDAPHEFDWCSLAELPKLRHLSFAMYPGQSIEPDSFSPLLFKLDSLEIRYQGIRRGKAGAFIRGPAPLRYLLLNEFDVQSGMLSQLACLTQLSLASSMITTVSWIGALKGLKVLDLTSHEFQGILSSFLHELSSNTFPELTVLTLGTVPYDRFHTLMDCITRLSKLEVLGIKVGSEDHSNKVLPLEQLAALDRLTELKEVGIFGPISLIVTNGLSWHLVSLISGLDALWVEATSAHDVGANALSKIKITAPTLKIFIGSNVYERFFSVHHAPSIRSNI